MLIFQHAYSELTPTVLETLNISDTDDDFFALSTESYIYGNTELRTCEVSSLYNDVIKKTNY